MSLHYRAYGGGGGDHDDDLRWWYGWATPCPRGYYGDLKGFPAVIFIAGRQAPSAVRRETSRPFPLALARL